MMTAYLAAIISVATISMFFSLSVVFTWLFFPQLRYKLFMQIIVYISVGDILGNLPYVFPYREHQGNWWCTLSGLLNFIGYPMEWMWTTTLIYLLYRLSVVGHIPKHMWFFHVLNWGLPTVLGLCTLAFGELRPPEHEYEICVTPLEMAPLLYHAITYYGIFFLCVIIMLYLFFRLRYYVYRNPPTSKPKQRAYEVTLSAARAYGSILLLFWLPHNISAIMPESTANHVYDILLILKVLHGVATALVFFVQSKEARRLWTSYFTIQYLRWKQYCRCCLWAKNSSMDNGTGVNPMNNPNWMVRTVSEDRDVIGQQHPFHNMNSLGSVGSNNSVNNFSNTSNGSHNNAIKGDDDDMEAEDLFENGDVRRFLPQFYNKNQGNNREGSEIVMPRLTNSSYAIS